MHNVSPVSSVATRPWHKSPEDIALLLLIRMNRSGGPEANPVTARVIERIEAQIVAAKRG